MSTLTVDTVNLTNIGDLPLSELKLRIADAWGTFTQEGTQTLLKSFNVASIADLGTGKTEITLATAMADANYVIVMGSQDSSAGSSNISVITVPTTTQFKFQGTDLSPFSGADVSKGYFAIYGGGA